MYHVIHVFRDLYILLLH